jgi:hypothetical protein
LIRYCRYCGEELELSLEAANPPYYNQETGFRQQDYWKVLVCPKKNFWRPDHSKEYLEIVLRRVIPSG